MQLHLVAAASQDGSLAPAVLLILLLSLLPAIVVYVWTALALSRVFEKLGRPGWAAWVPVYNAVVLLRLGGLSGWLLLLFLIPFFGQVFVYVAIVTAAHRVNAEFGLGAGMTVLAALLFPVWASVLGFGRAEPAPRRDSYVYATGDDAEAALRALSPDFGRPVTGEALFEPRRDVPTPSAWIPAADAAPAPAAVEPPAPAPPAPFPSAPPPSSPEPPPAPWTPPPAPAAPTPVEPATAPAPPEPEPAAPVTSWWMPGPEPAAPPVLREPHAPEPAAPPPLREPYAPEPAAPPVLREAYVAEPDAFPEDSGAVSAVVGSPVAGMPRAAASAVSAFRSGVGDTIDDETVIVARKRAPWVLTLPDGTTVDLTADAVVLGRRPSPVHTAPGAQLIEVVENTRTVSKTHALLRRQGESWIISDLGSTNGVVIDGAELAPGESVEVSGGFLLGDAPLRVGRRDEAV